MNTYTQVVDDPEMGYGSKSTYEGGYAEFMESQVRRGFIKKVFSILAVQLLVTFAVSFTFISVEGVKAYIQTNAWPFFLSIGLTLSSIIALSCCGDLSRRYPHNFILLGVFTLAESFLVGAATCQYDTDIVLLALGITVVLTVTLITYAFQTKYDFTTLGGILLCSLVTLMLFGFVTIFYHGKIMNLVYSSVGALLFSVYLVYDVQILMEGKRCQISPDEYVFAALNLYLDIIQIFMYILRILSEANR